MFVVILKAIVRDNFVLGLTTGILATAATTAVVAYKIARRIPLTKQTATIAVGLVGVVMIVSSLKKKKPKKALPSGGRVFQLMAMEHAMGAVAPPTILTIYEFPSSSDDQEDEELFGSPSSVEEFLKKRTKEVLAANPWLAGRLCRDPASGKPVLWVPSSEDSSTSSSLLLQVQHVESNDEVISRPPAEMFVKCGDDLLDAWDKDDNDAPPLPVFRVLLRYCSSTTSTSDGGEKKNKNQFSIFVSITHTIADAATLCSVWGLFKPSTPSSQVRSLVFDRLPVDVYSGQTLKAEAFKKIFWYALSCDTGPFRMLFFAKPQPGWFEETRYIRPEWIAEQKDMFKPSAGAPFLSANDLICAWFLETTKPDAGGFPVNMRGRVPAITDDHMGNYQELMMFYPREYSDPANIRRCVATLGGPALENGAEDKPGPGRRIALMTNWAPFYQNVQFAGCELVSHSIIVDGTHERSRPVPPLMGIFRPSADTLAAITITAKPLTSSSSCGSSSSWPFGERVPGTFVSPL